jgi:formylglycine-generating enzyme required for sulfatase activity
LPKQSVETSADHVPERRTGRFIEPDLIRIPAGEFWMGSDQHDKDAWDDEKRRHRLYLAPFWMARYPVTNDEYELFLLDNPLHQSPSYFQARHPPAGKARHPVVNVSWRDAVAYCQWLSRASGRSYTLPSEAEWEKAARGPEGLTYPWGNNWEPSRCNNSDSGSKGTTPVGQYSPRGDSPYGVADMAGNVWEWTRSKFKKYRYDSSDGRESLQGDDRRVLRGGSFDDLRGDVRCAYRSRAHPGSRFVLIGFRVVWVSPGS